MEKLYEVTLCKFKFIDKMGDVYQHIKEDVKKKQICIMEDEKFVNIKNNEEYDCLRNTDNMIICGQKSLDGVMCVVEAHLYDKDFSENEASLNYLRAISARRVLNNRAALEQHDRAYQKRR